MLRRRRPENKNFDVKPVERELRGTSNVEFCDFENLDDMRLRHPGKGVSAQNGDCCVPCEAPPIAHFAPHASIGSRNWFGTIRPVVQIHSPRPFFSSTKHDAKWGIWFLPRCPTVEALKTIASCRPDRAKAVTKLSTIPTG